MAVEGSEPRIELPQLEEPACESGPARRFLGILKCFGPAAILASISIGAGETIVAVRTGAWARYDLLWVVLLSCLVKGVFITYLLGRYTALTGEFIGQRLVRLPGPRGWFLLMIVAIELLFAPLAWVAIAKPCGNLIHFLIGCDLGYCENLYSTLFIAAALGISLTHTYKRLERVQVCLCGLLVLGTLTGTLIVWPDLWAALKGTVLVGRMPEEMPAWAPEDAIRFPWLNVATVFAYVGGSVAGYLAYANWVALRRWGLNGHPDIDRIRMRAGRSPRIDYLPEDAAGCRRLRRMLSPLHWDISQGAVVLFIVTAAFMISGAATLYGRQSDFKGWKLLTDQAQVWSNISGWLVPVYYGTILAALFGTLTALPEVYARVTQEFFSAIWPRSRWSFTGIRKIFAGVILIESTVLIWVGLDFEILTQLAGFLLSNLAVAATAVAALYLNFKLPPAYRVRRAILAGAVVSAAVMMAACAASTFGLARKLRQDFTVEEVEPRPAAQAAADRQISPAGEAR